MTSHALQTLRTQHQTVIDLWRSGLTPEDIASATGLTPWAVTRITSSPLFRHVIAEGDRYDPCR